MRMLLLLYLALSTACTLTDREGEKAVPQAMRSAPAVLGNTIETRFPRPEGYLHTTESPAGFGRYLRSLPLLPPGTPVHLYDGSLKANQTAHAAVIDLPIGRKNLHQCADAVMRLRADYLYHQERYEDIHFNFTNGFRVDYSKWRAGQRVRITGNQTDWWAAGAPQTSDSDYWKYLELIFTYAGTASLSRELKSVPLSEMRIGDVLIRGGHPGHAVIVVDMVVHPETGKRKFMLAQSYMPAQQLQVLRHPDLPVTNPWYDLRPGMPVRTPEWTFEANELKRFTEH